MTLFTFFLKMTQGFATLCCIISSFNSIFKNLGTEQFGFFVFCLLFSCSTAGGTLCHMLYLHRNLPVSTTAMMLEQVLTSWYQFNLPRKWRSRCSRKRMLPLKGPKITGTIFTSDRQRLYDALFYHLITLDCKDGSQSAYFCFVSSPIFWKVLLASN